MSVNGTSIYTGPWINWSRGLVLGSTITLSARNGAILTSFIATFVTIVGAQLWKIICFILHQTRASQEPEDGLYHQHQNVFRNSNTPGGAAWSFTLQSWYWWGRARHSTIRSLPWALFSMLYIVVFTVLSVFGSSEVAKAAGQDRLIRGSQCGYWGTDGTETGQGSFRAKILRDSQNAATYARDCYAGSADTLKCNAYATPYIRWEGKQAECPFKDGICYGNNTYQMDTGFIDSHHDLGINTPQKERLKYRRVATCSVLAEEGYIDNNATTQFTTWNYGPTGAANYTFSYAWRSMRANIGYTVNVLYSDGRPDSPWMPIAPLNRTDAVVHLAFITPNSIIYELPNDDPVFSAHLVSNISTTDSQGRNKTHYEADAYAGVIACTDQYQVCHDDTCTPLSSQKEVFSSLSGMSMTQIGIYRRLDFATVFTGITQIINGRSGTALRASETVSGTIQASLPSDQWQIEISSWFSTGLAMLQSGLRDYVSPTIDQLPGTSVEEPQNAADLAMCSSQKTLTLNGTVSFSVLGLSITFIVGTVLIFTSFILETAIGWLGLKTRMNWVLDDKLQLQRMVFESRGVRWTNIHGPVPVTEAGERFSAVGGSAENESLMAAAQDEKTVGMNVTEIR